MASTDPEYLLGRQPEEPKTQRLGAGKNFLWLLTGVGLTVLVACIWFRYTAQPAGPAVIEPKSLTRADLVGSPTSAEGVMPFQQQYLGHSREAPQSQPVKKPEPPTPEPLEKPVVTPLPDAVVAAATPNPFATKEVKKEELKKDDTKPTGEARTQQPAQQRGAQNQKPKLWLYAHIEANPFETKVREQLQGSGPRGAEQNKDAASDLIKPAHWARAADPVHVLYNTQNIEGSVRQEINSDTPGDVVILVTRNVYDALGQDEILIPQFSLLKGGYVGSTQYGQTRLDIGIRQIQFPDKTIVGLEKAKLTDKSGAVGGAGDVDRHLVQLGLAVVFSTMLNVGAQSVAGNTSGYYPTIEQKAAEQLGQGVNQAGQQIVKKQLDVGPTIKIHAGEAVGVQFSDNISFSKPPTIVK